LSLKQKLSRERIEKLIDDNTCSAVVIRKNASFRKSSRVNPPAITAAPPPPTAHKMLRTPRRPSSLLDRYSSPRGRARSSRTQRGVISSNVSSICASKSGERLLAPSSYKTKINISLFYKKKILSKLLKIEIQNSSH